MAVTSHSAPVVAPARPRVGWASRLAVWLTTVDHKRIGQLYLMAGAFFFVVGGVEAFLMRLQLAVPNGHVISAQLFDELFTMHGTTMIFLAAMPLLFGWINVVLPLMLGARVVAFPRLNALSFWLFLAGALLLNTSWFLGGAPNAGWFNYVPISGLAYNPGHAIDFYDLGLQIAGVGSLLSAINFLVTVINFRAPGMTWMRLPMFAWATVVTMVLILLAFPPFTVDLFLQMFDRLFGAHFFTVGAGGSPLLWSNLFWVFGHPEVYIVILPAFGMISEIVPTYSRKPLFGYSSMVLATMAIGFLSFMVWVHHMFDLGFGPWVNAFFALSSMLIAVPTGVKVFNWLATMWGGSIRLTTAMLWAIGFLLCFVIGGMSGVMLAMAPADLQFNNSYFVVAHFHYTLIGGVVFAILAATYHWFPKATGRLLDERLGKWSFWWIFIGFNLTFFPMHILGLEGMPRRIFTYGAGLGFTFWNQLSTAGVMVLTVGVLLLVYNVVRSLYWGELAAADPWDGRTLEWAVSSPPPPYNFAHLPLVRGFDAWWVEKRQGEGRLLPAPEPQHGPPGTVHMPSPTPLPIILAGTVMLAGYGLLFQSLWVCVIGFAAMAVVLHRSMFTPDPGQYLPVAEEPPAQLPAP